MKKFILSCFILCFIAIIAGCTNIFQWKYDYLVLVNKQHKLPEDWESKVELVEVKNAFDEDIKVEKEAYEQYLKLRDALLEEGVDIELDSVYRSVSRQEELRTEFEEEYGIDYTKKYVAVPWYSEHHTALAIDICIKKDWVLIYENDDMIAEKEIFDKIHAKLADYGFILRYLEWKEDITGYWYEPRHLRYVGDVKVAKEIMDKWLTLEEYLGEENIDTILPEDEPEINNEEWDWMVNEVNEPEVLDEEEIVDTPAMNVSINNSNRYPNAQKYCLDNNRKIITNDYWDKFCSREDGSYYELRAYEENWQAWWRWTDEPYCSIYEELVCGVDWISYTNECWLKNTWIEKDPNAKSVNGKCVSK